MIAPTSTARMTDAAATFLDCLDENQRAAAVLPFEDTSARHDWHYVPRDRAGLSLRDMESAQEELAYQLLSAGLSLPAFAATTTIIGLEDVLDQVEGGRRRRHRADYSVTVFGTPGSATWGWRLEGHHLSVNVTFAGEEVAATPLFLGSNPARIDSSSGTAVVRPLAAEEELAVELVAALSGSGRDEALLTAVAPADIVTLNAPTLEQLPDVEGVRVADLTGSAAAAAEALVRHYLDRLPADAAAAWWRRVQSELGDVRFAIAGGRDAWSPERAVRRGHGQYYRLAGPSLFVEYDNTQDGANHVHTVLRDPGADFGVDLLRRHRATHH